MRETREISHVASAARIAPVTRGEVDRTALSGQGISHGRKSRRKECAREKEGDPTRKLPSLHPLEALWAAFKTSC
jgi:hypothetical protein